jgi:hypothetical protein
VLLSIAAIGESNPSCYSGTRTWHTKCPAHLTGSPDEEDASRDGHTTSGLSSLPWRGLLVLGFSLDAIQDADECVYIGLMLAPLLPHIRGEA